MITIIIWPFVSQRSRRRWSRSRSPTTAPRTRSSASAGSRSTAERPALARAGHTPPTLATPTRWASHWSIQVTWPGYCPLIGQYYQSLITVPSLSMPRSMSVNCLPSPASGAGARDDKYWERRRWVNTLEWTLSSNNDPGRTIWPPRSLETRGGCGRTSCGSGSSSWRTPTRLSSLLFLTYLRFRYIFCIRFSGSRWRGRTASRGNWGQLQIFFCDIWSFDNSYLFILEKDWDFTRVLMSTATIISNTELVLVILRDIRSVRAT